MAGERIRWCENGVIPAPGTCSICGFCDLSKRKMAMLGIHVKFYGHVLLCEECVNTVASLPGAGYVPVKTYNEVVTERDELRGKLEPALRAVNNLRSSVSSLLDNIFTSGPAGDILAALAEPTKPEPQSDNRIKGYPNPTVSSKKHVGLFE